MSGTGYMILGGVILIAATAACAAAEWVLSRKRKRIREEIYQIYS